MGDSLEWPHGAILEAFADVGYEVPIYPRDTGHNRILCPLHDDSTSSAYVNLEANRWGCHACDISEDIIALLMREKKLGFLEARDYASANLGGSGNSILPVRRNGGRVSRKALWD